MKVYPGSTAGYIVRWAYLDKFLLGKADAPSTDILRSKFSDVDRGKWIPWTTPELK